MTSPILVDPVHGDQEDQFEFRNVLGNAVSYKLPLTIGGIPTEFEIGGLTRYDVLNVGRLPALYLHDLGPWTGGLMYRYLGNFPISSGPCVNSAAVLDFPGVTSCANAPTALGQINGKGCRQLNLDVHYALPQGWIASVGIFNLLNTHAMTAEFWCVDRLPSEGPLGQADIHQHPLEPFMIRFAFTKQF
jgi:hypothetical protein